MGCGTTRAMKVPLSPPAFPLLYARLGVSQRTVRKAEAGLADENPLVPEVLERKRVKADARTPRTLDPGPGTSLFSPTAARISSDSRAARGDRPAASGWLSGASIFFCAAPVVARIGTRETLDMPDGLPPSGLAVIV